MGKNNLSADALIADVMAHDTGESPEAIHEMTEQKEASDFEKQAASKIMSDLAKEKKHCLA